MLRECSLFGFSALDSECLVCARDFVFLQLLAVGCVFTAPALVTSLSVTDMLMVLTASFLILLDAAGALLSQKPPIKKTLWGLRE